MTYTRFLDGAMGTMLQRAGLQLGERPEILNLTHPDVVAGVHKAYIKAGAEVIYANTFGANAHKLEGSGYDVDQIIAAAVGVAKQATAGTSTQVALDLGPIGELLEPSGTLSFDQAYDLFKEQVVAGQKAGCDLVVIETMTDLYEVKAAILAVKENTDLPVFVTMTFEENGRTFTGCTLESFVLVADGLGVDALGINCSLGPDLLYPLAQKLVRLTRTPLIVKANAGLPDPKTGDYDMGPEAYAAIAGKMARLGIEWLGGCCGTTPDYIAQMIAQVSDLDPQEVQKARQAAYQGHEARVCTPFQVVALDRPRIVGERINPTGKKRFKQALIDRDLDYILGQALEQAEAGADILDVNVGLPEIDEPIMMKEVVQAIQSVTDLPLQIDASDPQAIEAGLRYANGKCIINSVNGEEGSLDKILPLAKKYGAVVIGLALDEDGIPDKAEDRAVIAQKIMDRALEMGIPKEDLVIDCLTLTVSAQQEGAIETLKAIRLVKNQLGLKTVLGVSNISFGLPNRGLINHSFLLLALEAGLDLAIINPNNRDMVDAFYVHGLLSNRDTNAAAYIERFRDVQVPTGQADQAQKAQAGTIEEAIGKGLKPDVRRLTRQLLETKAPMDIVNDHLIPALDAVGDRYEQGIIFLPQLIQAANASQEAFEILKDLMAQSAQETLSKGTIVIATVKGDVHDIGKNIVKVILENYGYRLVDLGRDVPIETVVQAAEREKPGIVGLSALMTTTLKSMEETITALRDSSWKGKIMVGGAVLTHDYAMQMGADYYAKDAKDSADYAKSVFE